MDLDDLDVEDVARWMGLALVGYVLLNFIRDRSATDRSGPVFPASAPAAANDWDQSAAGDILAPMQVSPSGIAFIKQQEGLTLTLHNDAGHQAIGYGHLIQPSDHISGSITAAYADQLLQADLAQTAKVLNGSITVPLSQNQFDALASLEYNIGASAFQNSTLLKQLNQGNYQSASQQFLVWNRSEGQVNRGLNSRRGSEQGMFNS